MFKNEVPSPLQKASHFITSCPLERVTFGARVGRDPFGLLQTRPGGLNPFVFYEVCPLLAASLARILRCMSAPRCQLGSYFTKYVRSWVPAWLVFYEVCPLLGASLARILRSMSAPRCQFGSYFTMYVPSWLPAWLVFYEVCSLLAASLARLELVARIRVQK